ncbi:hypothetical protein UVI_02015100 [Ustilaginoidea virens]|uniref:Uncharacterized protein n=1 Tax=Ustilaginoidea virens TaxID=1159556 RepID=A0A1B5L5G3_USTVR|nr:hypothetical protein UVI_02015100 [Ustilaginoidea virens]
MQTLVPAVRVATQILGVVAGKRTGMMIIQCTQVITILGGPAGYILVVNIIAGEVVEPVRRTAVFGRLQGAIMLGQGIGYLGTTPGGCFVKRAFAAGGMIGDAIDIRAPFDVACISFLVSCAYAYLFLPYISPDSMSSAAKPGQKHGFLAPLTVLVPQRLCHPSGKTGRHFGVIALCAGIFLGVLATGYAPFLIQMYATAEFDFSQADNGWLMFAFALMRSIFLLFMFPPIISKGRQWMAARASSHARQLDEGERDEAEREPGTPPCASREVSRAACRFDLVFLRWSLVVDGALTTAAAFATKGWHMYIDLAATAHLPSVKAIHRGLSEAPPTEIPSDRPSSHDAADEVSGEEIDAHVPHGKVLLGTNARGGAARARRLLGWEPRHCSLEEDIPRVVAQEHGLMESCTG